MPDFTYHPRQQCLTARETHVDIKGSTGKPYVLTRMDTSNTEVWECSCPAYMYSKAPKGCKHIKKYLANVCAWHEEYGIPQVEEGVCPECGLPTEGVMFAI